MIDEWKRDQETAFRARDAPLLNLAARQLSRALRLERTKTARAPRSAFSLRAGITGFQIAWHPLGSHRATFYFALKLHLEPKTITAVARQRVSWPGL